MSPLPIYSLSGFDLLSIVAPVVTRPNPEVIYLFVTVNTRRFDNPDSYRLLFALF